MGLRIGRRSQGESEKSGDEASPCLEQDVVHKSHFPKKLKPHLPHQSEKTHLRRPGSPKHGEALEAAAATEVTTPAGQSSKSGLTLKNPFSRKKHLHAKQCQEKDVRQSSDESFRAHEPDVPDIDGISSVPPGVTYCKDITRQHTEAGAVPPISYKSFGHKLDCENDMAAQAERQKAIIETLAGKTWREKLQWGLDSKNLGNVYYQQKKITEAISAYEDCLLALDFGSTPEEQQTVQQQLQLPVVLNLAACMLAIKCHQK